MQSQVLGFCCALFSSRVLRGMGQYPSFGGWIPPFGRCILDEKLAHSVSGLVRGFEDDFEKREDRVGFATFVRRPGVAWYTFADILPDVSCVVGCTPDGRCNKRVI